MIKYTAALFIGLGSLGLLLSQTEYPVSALSQPTQQLAKAIINIDDAKTIALKQVDGKIINISLQHEGRTLVYDVSIQKSEHVYAISVDAKSGKILYIKKELKKMNH